MSFPAADVSPYERLRLRNIHDIQNFMFANGLRNKPPSPMAQQPPEEPASPPPTVQAAGSQKPPRKFASKDDCEVNFNVGVSSSGDGDSKRVLRPRKKVDYTEEIVPNRDDFIYCDICREEFFEGCSEHPSIRNEDRGLVVVGQSSIKNAGRGVFNNSTRTIPVGTLFGPYRGQIIKPADYAARKESGYAWELMDSDKKRVIGFVDPGSDPDPATDWLSIVNSANYARDQNMIAVQFKGQIMYRVCRAIAPGSELLTYYGDAYARSLQIDPRQFKHGVGHREHWDKIVTEGVPKGRHLCDDCGQTFTAKNSLKLHIVSIHEGIKWPCPICDKRFTQKGDVKTHVSSVHGLQRFQCGECGKKFTKKGHLTVHIKTVHRREKPHSCFSCGVKFGHKSHLLTHIRSLHPTQLKEWEESHYKYHCSTCGTRFATMGGLSLHKEKMHKEE